MTHNQFNDLMIMISELWSTFQVTEVILDVWEESLSPCDYESMVYCVKSIARDSMYPPKLAELLSKYNNGLDRIDNEIKSGCSWLYQYHAKCKSNGETEDWQNEYVEFVKGFPVIKQMAVAINIVNMFTSYADAHIEDNIDFKKWLDGVKSNA